MATYGAEVERWRPLVEKYFPAELVDKALFVINGESGGNPSAVGDGGAARSLFQIQDNRNFPDRPDAAWLDNPENNIKYAAQQLGAASGNFGAWGEGVLHEGKKFGALGNNPYGGGGGSPVIDYSDPQIDADYQGRKQAYQAAFQAWVAAGRPQAWVIDDQTGEMAPNDKSPEGFAYASSLMDLQEFTQTFGQPKPANDTDPAQQAFDNAIKLGDLDERKAQTAWTRFTDKLTAARTATNDMISTARQENIDNNVDGAWDSNGNLRINAAQAGRRTAPDYTKAFEAMKTRMNVGEEPATSGYTAGIATPPANLPNRSAPTGAGGAAPKIDMKQYPGNPDGWQGPLPPTDLFHTLPRLGVSTGDPAGTVAAGYADAFGGSATYPAHTSDPQPPAPSRSLGQAATLPPVRSGIASGAKKVKKWWQKVPGFADGVQGFAGGEAMMGERGPEKVEIPGFGDFMVGMDGPEVRTLPPGSNVIPMDQQYLFQQIQGAAKQGGQPDMMRQSEEAQARANDPQLQQKVEESLRQAMSAQWATKPPVTPVLVGEGWESDPWADRRALTGVPADPAQYAQMQAEAAKKGAR